MNFDFTEEQQMFADSVRRFARAELADGALERAHIAGNSWDVARKIAQAGLLGITLKSEDGGLGGSLMDAVIAIQETALVCPKSADIVQAGNFRPIRPEGEMAAESAPRRDADQPRHDGARCRLGDDGIAHQRAA